MKKDKYPKRKPAKKHRSEYVLDVMKVLMACTTASPPLDMFQIAQRIVDVFEVES
jgi:hypothetical protein